MSGMMAGITATPIRRSGSWLTKSLSQRLWARLPSITSRGSPAAPASPVPNGRRRHATGAEYVGVGEQHLGHDALAVEDLVACRRVERCGQPSVAVGLLLPLGPELGVGVVTAHGFSQRQHLRLVLVEALTEARIQVVAVDVGRWTGVSVGRNDQVIRHRTLPFRTWISAPGRSGCRRRARRLPRPPARRSSGRSSRYAPSRRWTLFR